VYFETDATKAQESAVKRMFLRDRRVRSLRFVSKAEALAILKRRFPKLAAKFAPGANPLPDSLWMKVDRSQLRAVGTSLGLPRPGVDKVTFAPKPCGQ
jgi:cell division protein FtsX